MTVCRDLTVKEKVNEAKKKPIRFLYIIAMSGVEIAVTNPSRFSFIDKVCEIDFGRCIMAGYMSENDPAEQKSFYIGYWNDGVAE